MKLDYKITNHVLSIYESYQENSLRGMMTLLREVREANSENDYEVLKRSDRGIIEEWIVHNLFYDLHVLRDHTRTVDLEAPQAWYFRIAYHLVFVFNRRIRRF